MPSFANQIGCMIAVPHSGRAIVPEFAWCLTSIHPPMNYNTRYGNIYGANVDDAREHLCEQAILQECRYLFFMGDDVTCPGHTLRQLIYFMDNNPKCGVIGGIYCQKQDILPMPLVFRGNGAGAYMDWKVGEVFQVSGIGMDCTLIRVDALKSIPRPWFKTIDDATGMIDGKYKSENWTEDLFFCDKAVKAGWEVWADGGILCDHWDAQQHKPYRMDPSSKPLQREGIGGLKIVDLGCGSQKMQTDEGKVLGVDIRELPGVDYRCDLHTLPFATGEFDIVFSSHTLEHFSRAEMDKLLDEWIRILRPEGEFRLVLPNVEWAAKRLTENPPAKNNFKDKTMTGFTLENDILNVLYGSQEYEQNFHKNAFWPDRIREILEKRGFNKIEIDDTHYYNLIVRAWRTGAPKVELKVNEVGKWVKAGKPARKMKAKHVKPVSKKR